MYTLLYIIAYTSRKCNPTIGQEATTFLRLLIDFSFSVLYNIGGNCEFPHYVLKRRLAVFQRKEKLP
jgi:hypothetical protein